MKLDASDFTPIEIAIKLPFDISTNSSSITISFKSSFNISNDLS